MSPSQERLAQIQAHQEENAHMDHEDRLPAHLDEIPPYAPEINRQTGRRNRTIILDMLVLHASGHLNIKEMQRHYAEQVQAYGRYQPREKLLAQLAAHIEQVCPELTDDARKQQLRLAANAVFVGAGAALLP